MRLLFLIFCFMLIIKVATAQTVIFEDDFEGGLGPAWIQPNGGWVWEDGHIVNTSTCGFQQCMPDIWAGGSEYSDYMVSADICIESSPGGNGTSLSFYIMGEVAAEHYEGKRLSNRIYQS